MMILPLLWLCIVNCVYSVADIFISTRWEKFSFFGCPVSFKGFQVPAMADDERSA